MPIDAYVARDKVDLGNYMPAVMDAYKFKDHVYALPKDVDAIALWYNKELFKQAGVDYPTADWTWDDLTAAAQKLTDPAKGVYGIAAPAEDQANYDNTILQAGGQIISADGKKSGYDSPEAIRGLQLWVDLINKYHASPVSAADDRHRLGADVHLRQGRDVLRRLVDRARHESGPVGEAVRRRGPDAAATLSTTRSATVWAR